MIWEEMEGKNHAEAKPDHLLGIEERTRNWIYARSGLISDGNIVVTYPEIEEMV